MHYKVTALYSKTKQSLSKRQQIGFQDQLSFNADQKYCKVNYAILLTFIKLPFVIKIFVLSFFEWPFYTGFTVLINEKRRLTILFEWPSAVSNGSQPC